MSRTLLAALAAALAAPSLSAAPVPPDGNKGTVFPYPAKAPVVVCLNGIDKSRERFEKMLAAALPEEAAKLSKLLDAQLSKYLEGRKLTAVRKDARLFVVVNDLGSLFDGTPALSVLVPVTSYKEFLDTFPTRDELKTLDRGNDGVDTLKTAAAGEERPVHLVDLKEYAAVTPDRATADGYAVKYTAATSEAFGPDLAETFLKSDAAVYVNMDQINDQYGEQIQQFKKLMEFGIQQAQQQGMLPGFGKKQVEAMKELFKALFQGVTDCRGVVVAAEFRPEGLNLRLQIRFADGTPSANLVQEEKPGPLAELARFPAGLGMYQASKVGRTISDATRTLAQEYATTEDDERGAELIEQHTKDLIAAGSRGEFAAATPGGGGIAVADYKDAAKAAKATAKLYKAIAAGGRAHGVIVKTAPRVTEEAEKHRGFTFTEVKLNFDFEGTAAALPANVREATIESLKRVAEDKAVQWVGTDGKVLVTLTAKNWEAAKSTLDKYLDAKPAVGADAGFKLTRSQLPPEVNLLIIGETGATLSALADGVRSAGDSIPGFPAIGRLKPAKGPPTYVGLAVTLKGDTVTANAFVPTGAIAAGRTILDGLFKTAD